MSTHNALDKAKSRMLLRHAFFASLVLCTPTIANESVPTAATDMKKIIYNPKFIEGLDREVQLFVLAHEVMHIALKHGLRNLGRDPELWNIACDFAINIILRDSGFKIWDKCCIDQFNGHPVKFEGMSAEQIYPELLKFAQQKPANGAGKNEQGGLSGDLRPAGDLSTEERGKLEREINQMVAQAATAAKMAGHIKGSLAHLVDGILQPPLTWKDLLREYCTKVTPEDESWSHRNRRFQHTYLPGRRSEAMGELVIIGDTSGSLIGSDIFAQIGAEIAEIREQVKPDCVRVVWADDDECSLEEVFEPNDEVVLHPKGGGGTDMRKPIRFVERYEPIVCVLVTDGYTPWPEDQTPFPLIVLCNTDAPVPDWAMRIRI